MIQKEVDEKFVSWIEENKEKVLKKWMDLIKIPSVKSEPMEDKPNGEMCSRALHLATSYFGDEKIQSEVYLEGGYALAHLGKSKKRIGIFSHSDVVPVGDDWIYTKPFEPIIKDGALIGRGAEDNKSGIMAGYCILKFLKNADIELNSELELFIGSDEECGMTDLDAYLKDHKVPEISFVPDAEFPCSKGEKGIYHFLCESKEDFVDVISVSGGEAKNIVLDKAVAEIKFSKELFDEIESKIKDNASFEILADESKITLTAKGIAKHASEPDGSVNGGLLIFDLLKDCESLSKTDRNIFKNASTAISDYYGKGINVDFIDSVFGKTTAVNGMIFTSDKKLTFSFDVRYGSGYSAELLEENSDKALSALGFNTKDKDNSPGFAIDPESDIPEKLEEIFFEMTGEKKESILMGGGTYARRLKNAFSLGTFYTPKDKEDSVLKMPAGHGSAHQCDEMIDIDSFFLAVRILLQYILAVD